VAHMREQEMSRNSRRKRQKPALEGDLFLLDDDHDSTGHELYDLEWMDDELPGSGTKTDARRRIERYRDMKSLYSELDEWEEFGSRDEW